MTALDKLRQTGIDLRHFREGGQRVPCPLCDKGPRDTALSVTVEHDRIIWLCFRCQWAGAVRDRSESTVRPPQRPQKARSEPERHETLAPRWREFWNVCVPITADTVAGAYLRGRGCALPPEDGDLRWHAAAYHWPSQSTLPAMVGLISDAVTNSPISLHLTFLRAEGTGKADVERPRLLLPKHRKAGGVVRLWPDEAVTHGLAIAEGIETTLTIARGYAPAWCAIDCGNLAAFPVLGGIECLMIAVDLDPAGVSAAEACAIRWTDAGRDVRTLQPDIAGTDINDQYGCAA